MGRLGRREGRGDWGQSPLPFRVMEEEIDSFIRFLAVERGLSENYQLSTQRSLARVRRLVRPQKKIAAPRCDSSLISEYLDERKRAGLSASSIKLIVVALKIFFRFLAGKGRFGPRPDRGAGLATDRALFAGNFERTAGGTTDRKHRHQSRARIARPGDRSSCFTPAVCGFPSWLARVLKISWPTKGFSG